MDASSSSFGAELAPSKLSSKISVSFFSSSSSLSLSSDFIFFFFDPCKMRKACGLIHVPVSCESLMETSPSKTFGYVIFNSSIFLTAFALGGFLNTFNFPSVRISGRGLTNLMK
jgi:hypothetical protein